MRVDFREKKEGRQPAWDALWRAQPADGPGGRQEPVSGQSGQRSSQATTWLEGPQAALPGLEDRFEALET